MIIRRISLKDYQRFLNKNLESLEENNSITFYTFKRDRKISVSKKNNLFFIAENGFKDNNFENLDKKHCIKLMEKLKDIEFPRSNILHIEIEKWD